MVSLASLPEDIITDILSRLSVKSISRLRCVCKLWYEFFKNPMFIKTHHRHAIENNKFSLLLHSYTDSYQYVSYAIDFDVASSNYHTCIETDLPPKFNTYMHGDFSLPHIFSCDGLIGSHQLYDGNKICLWNPSTREYKYISSLNRDDPYYGNFFSVCMICYDWKIHDYKLFKFLVPDNSNITEVWVSKLGSNSWNRIRDIPYSVCIDVSVKPLNGIIHWVQNTEVIVSYDIVEELLKEIQLPNCYPDVEGWNVFDYMEVGVLGEDIYLLVSPMYSPNIDLWVMKDYGVVDSWTKIFTISEYETRFDKLIPLQYLSKNGEILLKAERFQRSHKDVLVSYNPKTRGLVILDIPCMPEYFHATTYIGSLVSLNSGEFIKASKMGNLLLFDPLHLRESYKPINSYNFLVI